MRKVVEVNEEWMYGDKLIGKRRKVDVVELECGHKFWQEKTDLRNKDEDCKFKDGVCDACFMTYLTWHFKSGEGMFKFYEKYLRKFVI